MRVGLGLPNPIPGTPAPVLVEWAREAEAAGFSTVATIDRVAFPTHDSLTTLAAAAVATERIGLATNVLLAPTRSPALLAKAVATVDELSGGRLTLGLGVGGRIDDYAAVGGSFSKRGAQFDALLATLSAALTGAPVMGSPEPVVSAPRAVPLLIGGTGRRAIRRAARWGAGWTVGGAGPVVVERGVAALAAEWTRAGRPGAPRVVALAYAGLGRLARSGLDDYLRRYYRYLSELNGAEREAELAGTSAGSPSGPGAGPVEGILADVLRTPAAIRGACATTPRPEPTS
jgi:alkanesulfonate monooxygenase SsuD/methylene tetrahydromethanopterin reductase-like flavin-dependent oxidoreductase (luciferase family)